MSRLTDGWLDGYGFWHVPNPRSGGSTYDPEGEDYPWRIVLHSTESRDMPNTAAHGSPPQLWACYETGELIQTIPLTRGGYALYQASSAPYYTNRARALQVELVGYADEAGAWPDDKLRWIAEVVCYPICKFVESVGGRIDLSDAAVPLPGAHGNSAKPDAPQRLAPDVWAFGPIGLAQHRHVPMGDDHYDVDQLNARRIRDLLVAKLGGPGYPQPVPTEPRRRIDPVEMHVRRSAPTVDAAGEWQPGKIVVDKAGYGFAGPIIYYDAQLVPAGSKAVIGPRRPDFSNFEVVAVVTGDKPPERPKDWAGWGRACVTLVKSDSWVTLVVPEACIPENVRAYIV